MQKKNIFKKKINKSVLSITKRIESFFNFFREIFFKKKKKFSEDFQHIDKRIFISIAAIVITIISYFLVPAFYDKSKIKLQFENQILDQYNLKVKFDKNLKYGLLPKPHFVSENATIEYDTNDIAQTKNLKIFITLNNFISLDKIKIKNLLFRKTEFRVKKSNFKFFIDLLNINKSDKDINFINSKFFYLDRNDDVVFLSNLKRLNYLYQDNLLKKLNSKLDIFNIPISLYVEHDIKNKKFFSEMKSFSLRLNLKNNSKYNERKLSGELDIDIINKNKRINYSLANNHLKFNTSDNKFDADISIKPFYLLSNLKFYQINLKDVFKVNSILVNVIKSEVLNNQNLNGRINVNANNFKGINFLDQIKFEVLLEEGNIYIQNFITSFKDSVNINIGDVQLIVDDNKLKFAGYITLEFVDVSEFFRHYQIDRIDRKNLKKISFGFLLNLDDKLVEIDNLKVDGNTNQNLERFLDNFNSEKKDIFNKIVRRNLVKDFFKNF